MRKESDDGDSTPVTSERTELEQCCEELLVIIDELAYHHSQVIAL